MLTIGPVIMASRSEVEPIIKEVNGSIMLGHVLILNMGRNSQVKVEDYI